METTKDVSDELAQSKVLTFDCYGTLIDWEAGLADSFLRIFGLAAEARMADLFEAYVEEEAVEEAGPYQSYRKILAATVRRMADRFGWDSAGTRADFLADLLPQWRPFPDTNEALSRLKMRYRLGVLSNIDRDLFAGTAKQFEVRFDFVITAQDVQNYKPNLAHFREALEQVGGDGPILHVGQSLYHDGAAAAQLAIPFVWINRYRQQRGSDARTLAEYPDLRSLADAADVAATEGA